MLFLPSILGFSFSLSAHKVLDMVEFFPCLGIPLKEIYWKICLLPSAIDSTIFDQQFGFFLVFNCLGTFKHTTENSSL